MLWVRGFEANTNLVPTEERAFLPASSGRIRAAADRFGNDFDSEPKLAVSSVISVLRRTVFVCRVSLLRVLLLRVLLLRVLLLRVLLRLAILPASVLRKFVGYNLILTSPLSTTSAVSTLSLRGSEWRTRITSPMRPRCKATMPLIRTRSARRCAITSTRSRGRTT